MTKKTVILRGPVLTESGYGVHARQIARWLFDLADKTGNIDVVTEPLPWGATPWLVDVYAHDGLVGRLIQAAGKRDKYDVSLQLQLPNEWNPFLADYNVGITAGVEGDVCNPAWISAINRMDLVIVPSEFVKNVFANTGEVKTKIVVIPEAFFDAIVKPELPQLDLDIPTNFNFLVFGQITGNNPENDRKNTFYTVKWLCEQFKDNPDVGVVIKTNTGRQTVVDRIRTTNMLAQLTLEVKKGAEFPKIYLLHGDMSDDEVAALYRHPKIKALVAPSRGEGFGLPLLEAAVSGLPVMATGWSAHTEFLGKGKYIKFDYRLEQIHQSRADNQIWMPNAKWANVKEDDFKHRLKKFVDSPEMPQQWARELAETLKKQYSFDTVALQYTEVFKDVLG